MLRFAVAAAIAAAVLVPPGAPAAARPGRPAAPVCDNLDQMRPCQAVPAPGRGRGAGLGALKPGARYQAFARRRAHGRASLGLGGADRPYADRRCAGPGRYEAMRQGADCFDPPRDQVARPPAAPVISLPHPAGCPRRAFCGCGAAVRLFGRPVRELWLVANWPRRFPSAPPAPGRAAIARNHHHIVVLDRPLGGDLWLVYDANSGGHATRLHARSIAGWLVVDPRGGA